MRVARQEERADCRSVRRANESRYGNVLVRWWAPALCRVKLRIREASALVDRADACDGKLTVWRDWAAIAM